MADLETEITEAAQGPKAASGDQGSVTQHSLRELIEADKYLLGKTAEGKTRLGLRFLRFQHPGTA